MLISLGKGWSMSCLVCVHLYVQNMADFAEINAVYRTYFGINPPARVCVQAQLPKDVAVQIDCYGNHDIKSRQTMHVQGLSHWAPANIGPYSQCVKVKNRLYVAGQIPLVPGSMKILKQGIQAEAKLALQHVSRVLDAMHPECTIADTSHVVCYVTHPQYVEAVRLEWIKYLSNYYVDMCNTFKSPYTAESFTFQNLSPEALGHHGIELVMERKDSYFFPGVVGIICSGTKVIFTYLELTQAHYEKIQMKGEKDGMSLKSHISYTRPYDFMDVQDRKELLQPLTWLGYLQSAGYSVYK
ncbi:hypothetical protein FSP39_009663 [Pinctada imbricata]|uniref:Uncharacterized protein n=1 Tax=Pinctada imbricata TaxID=66713 RepID=A0AA88YB06_PINIB|nr:hypothetical protein FSP39_009663 [Pinctada imbricata]